MYEIHANFSANKLAKDDNAAPVNAQQNPRRESYARLEICIIMAQAFIAESDG